MPPEEQHRLAGEARFHDDMERIWRQMGQECGWWANRFLQMVRRRGGVEAAKRLLAQQGTSRGFERLRECGCLDLSMEALVLRPEYAGLFTEQEKAVARRRLLDAGYDPDQIGRSDTVRRSHM
jgi:hypothetical protein